MTRKELREYIANNPADIYEIKFISELAKHETVVYAHFEWHNGSCYEYGIFVQRCLLSALDDKSKEKIIYTDDTYGYRLKYIPCYPFLPKEIVSVEAISEETFLQFQRFVKKCLG